MHRDILTFCLLVSPALAQIVSPFGLDPRAPLTGGFEKEPIPADTLYAQGIAIGDVDVDGLGDLLVGALTASGTTAYGFRYYHNRGDGTFDDFSASHTAGGPIGIGNFVLADIDGDGDIDVVGTSSVLRNQQGVLVQEQLPATTSNRVCVAAGDIDGDGDLDLFFGVGFAGGPSRQDRLMINLGGGVFQFAPVSWLPVDNDNTQDARFFDADGDGDLDLVVCIELAGPGTGGARLYTNDGTGIFTDASASFPAPVENVLAVATGDFDLDGDQDVVLGTGVDVTGGERPDRFLRNLGGGQFVVDANALPGVLATTNDIVTADIDGDGDADLLLADGVGAYRQQRVYRNDGTVFTDVSASWLPPELLRAGYWAAGSLDADNRVDAALVTGLIQTGRPGRVRVFLNRGGSSFLLLNPARAPALSWAAIPAFGEPSFVDVDADGDLDWFVPVGGASSSVTQTQVLLRNDGHARLQDVSASALPGPLSAAAARFADVDADGDPDILLGTNVGVVQWRNNGTGNFVSSAAGTMPTGITNISTLCLGDVDNDGDVDVFAGRATFSTFDELLRNDGTGVFTRDTTALPTHSNSGAKSCAMLDYDGDGDLDLVLVLGSGSLGFLNVYRNNGAGQFSVVTGVMPTLSSVARIVTFDADGDGDLDLIAAESSSMTFLIDQGTTFSPMQPAGLQGLLQSARFAGLFDYDGDGDLDVAVDVFGVRRLLRNDGAFQFREVASDLVEGSVSIVASGADLDGDRDADFVLYGTTRDPVVVVGRRIQLHAPWLARVGLPYHLYLHYLVEDVGRLSAAVFVLNTSRLTPPIQVPPFGALSVDPVGAVFGLGFVPTSQDATDPLGLRCAYVLPNSPGLIGATLYSQALFLGGQTSVFTNLIADQVY